MANEREPTPSGDSPNLRRPARRKSSLIVAGMLGVGLASILGGATAIWLLRSPYPLLTQQQYLDAKSQWSLQRPEDYDITIRVESGDVHIYQVKVRQGEAISASLDGQQLTGHRTLASWSVEGMLDIISQDFERVLEQQEAKAQTGQSPTLWLRGEFDTTWGYPRRYLRIDRQMQHQVEWQVTLFDPQPAESADDS